MVSLGRGEYVPYPEPGDAVSTRIGQANKGRDTRPEVALRSSLHRRGLWLTLLRGHLILGSAPEEGARVGPPIEVPAGVPA